MTTAVELLSFIPTGATRKRSLGDWTGDVVNAKNFTGVVGDGSNDDTAGLQAAIDAAFGPSTASHGGAADYTNKKLFIPNGNYKVVAPASLTVTGAVSASGKVKLTVSTIANFGTAAQAYKTGQLCFITGVGGVTSNGSAIDGNFGIIVNDATHITLRHSSFGGTYTSGGSVKRAALQICNVDGASIMGAGRGATTITASANTSSILAINGMARSRMEGITLDGAGGSTNVCMDLDWDFSRVSDGDDITSQSTQSNTFYDMEFNSAAYGIRMGNHGQQVSENTIINCCFSVHTVAGISIQNYNALQMQIFGGNMQGCAVGIQVLSGSCPVIVGMGFQNTTGVDIDVDNTADDGYFIAACRSETTNFASFNSGPGVHLSGCVQIAASAGTFLFYENGGLNTCLIDACRSQNGVISSFSNGHIWIRGGSFGNSSFVTTMGSGGRIIQWDLGPIAVASLPTAGAHLQGLRQLVTDSNATVATGHGNTVAGGGANICPVYCDGTNWKIG